MVLSKIQYGVFIAFIMLVVAVLFMTQLVNSKESPAPAFGEPGRKHEASSEKADQILRQMCQLYSDSENISVKAQGTLRLEAGKLVQEQFIEASCTVKKNNRFYVDIKLDNQEYNIFCDGNSISIYLPQLKQYMKQFPPVGNMMDHQSLNSFFNGVFFKNDPYQSLMEMINSNEYIGVEKIDGLNYHKISLFTSEGRWDLWISTDEKNPVVRRTLLEQTGKTTSGEAVKIIKKFDYTQWELDLTESNNLFVFTPPSGVRLVPQFEFPTPEDLIGKPAPDFTLELFNGGQVNLSQHKGKDIVILDFWASSCGPCAYALPVMEKVAKTYKDKGVVVYAINLKESRFLINQFLEDNNLKLNVLMDRKLEVNNKYNIRGLIPTTIIIGKDGIVKYAHVGIRLDGQYARKIEEQYARELELLMSDN